MKRVLIAVDLQNDFIDGALGTKEAEAIVDNAVAKIKSYNGEDDIVIATMDTHQENYMDTAEGHHLPVVHCIDGTKGWEINSKVQKALDEVDAEVICKPTFGSMQLVERLEELSVKNDLEIELIGLCTDICVVSNVLILKALLPDTEIYVDDRCCAGLSEEAHNAALLTMNQCQVNVRSFNKDADN